MRKLKGLPSPSPTPGRSGIRGPNYKGMRSQYCNCDTITVNSNYSMRQNQLSVPAPNLTSSQ
eukprot:754413-Hanusia_phi.AAC.1